ILYEILTNRPPYAGKTAEDIFHRIQSKPPDLPTRSWPKAPRALEAVCLKAMAKNKEQRYASAKELSREIEQWLADEPVEALPESRLVKLARWARKHRALVTGAAAAFLVALIGSAAGSLWYVNHLGGLRAEASRRNTLAEVALKEARRHHDELYA